VAELPATSIGVHFALLTDPRIERCKLHPLAEIVTIALGEVRCGRGLGG
jgi:hypothetical protein